MKLLGFMARNQFGHTLHLTDPKHPRAQLIAKAPSGKVSKMYVDLKAGGSAHIGYVIGRDWWTIYEVHAWEGKA